MDEARHTGFTKKAKGFEIVISILKCNVTTDTLLYQCITEQEVVVV